MKNEQNRPQGQENSSSSGGGKKRKGKGNAANLDAIISSPTNAARSHRHTDTWSNQGTNVSYEGPTAPGGGGSVGTGYASGQDAVGARITTSDNTDHARAGRSDKKEKGEDLSRSQDMDDELDRETMGTP